MKKNILVSFKLSFILVVICAVLYPILIAGISKAAPGGGKGERITVAGKVVGYKNVGQLFTSDNYFWGRPSAAGYNAAGSAGSNKGPSSPDYLKLVQERIDSFLVHNPGVRKDEIPAEMVTASGSGLDPHISPAAALIQVKRIAAVRGLEESVLRKMISEQTETNWFSPAVVNVLKLNVTLDALKK